jgi:hypothetical protein
MTRLTGEIRTNLPVHEAIVACAEAIDGLGWHIEAVEPNRIVSHADSGSQHPPKVEVVLGDSGQATLIRIIGTDTDAEPLSQDALIADLDRLRYAINASLDGAIEAPTRTTEAPPATTEAPPQRSPADVGRKIAIAGIIGLIAIGLGIIGIAIVNDSSENPDLKRDRGGIGSTKTSKQKTSHGTSKQNNSQQNNSQSKSTEGSATTPPQESQEPAAPGSLSLGESAEIRDGDQHFTLTPTGVGREGSYITLEIDVAGLGGGGYDTTGRVFLGTLFGSNGRRYELASSGGPDGCEPPTGPLSDGQTDSGCLPFKVPQGVAADTFRYEPFFIGGRRVEWNLK